MANWQSFVIEPPGKELLEPVRNVLETLLIFLDVLKAILDTIKAFLVDFGNPIKALVEALIKLINELLLSLKATGIGAYYDVPDPTTDPNFDKVAGGFQAFTERFKASLFDPLDFNRPQPRSGSTQSGFVILVVDAPNVYTLIKLVKQLLRFFGKEFTSPRYEPPVNLQAFPVGSSDDPITAVASMFTSGPIKAIELRWSLPTSVSTPDPGFSDVVTKVAREFIPPQFLIERSTVNVASTKIDISELQTESAAGLVEFDRETFTSVRNPTQPVLVRQALRDEYGDQVIKFQKYVTIGQLDLTAILGQLGTFRFIDDDVKVGSTYYYRVRAYSGDLKMVENQVAFPTQDDLSFSIESYSPIMEWPAVSEEEGVVMGKASGIISASVPAVPDPATFDVMANLKCLFQTAFSLDFHLQASEDAAFDDSGNPESGTSPSEVGRGSLVNLASALAAFESFLTVVDLSQAKTINASFQPNPITGELPELPWQRTDVRKQAARLSDTVASVLLQAGDDALNGFRNIMQSTLPAGPISTGGTLAGKTTLEQVVKSFTVTGADAQTMTTAAKTFVEGYSDASLRLNVLDAVQFLKSYTLGGAPVDWISVVPLRDIVPWSGQMLYDLVDKIQALLDAFNGVMDEIKAFIDLLERKIAALERFIEFLINILDFIESLQLGAYMLSVTGLTGGPQSWVDAVDTAGGVKPSSGPGGYSAGVSFGYVVTDATAITTAFSTIFGG